MCTRESNDGAHRLRLDSSSATQLENFHQPADLLANRLLVEGFGEIVFSAALDRLDGRLDGPESGHDHHSQLRIVFPQLIHQGKPVGKRHDEIDQRQADTGHSRLDRQRLLARKCNLNRISFAGKEISQRIDQTRIVVHYQNPTGMLALHGSPPLPGVPSRQIGISI